MAPSFRKVATVILPPDRGTAHSVADIPRSSVRTGAPTDRNSRRTRTGTVGPTVITGPAGNSAGEFTNASDGNGSNSVGA